MKNRIILILLFSCSFSFGQNAFIDSLKGVIYSNANDTTKMDAYVELTYEYMPIDLDTAEHFGTLALQKYSGNSNIVLVSDLYAALGGVHGYKRNFEKALQCYGECLKLLKKTNKKEAVAKTHFNIGLAYYYTSQFQKAAENYLEALKILEGGKDKSSVSSIYTGLGTIYKEMKNYVEAFRCFDKAKGIYTANKDTVGLAIVYNSLGTVYDVIGKQTEAIESYKTSIALKEKIGYQRGLSSTMGNIGILLSKQEKLDEALEYFNRSISYSGPNEDRISEAVAYEGIGYIHFKRKDYNKALMFMEKSLALSLESNSKVDLISTYEKMAICYAAKGNFQKAYQYQSLFSSLKDSVLNVDNSKMITEMATKYETEKKQLQIDNLNKDNELKSQELSRKELEVKQQNMLKIFFASGFILVSVLAFFIFRGYRQKQHSNVIISEQKKEVEHHRDLIEAKNKEITDSIYYAQRIQKALLAGDLLLKKNLPEYFVFYKPKDIVSGDFYWANIIDNKFFLCVADCTGHGVPGAFMSLLNISFLNEALIEKKIDSPDKVLDHVRNQIIHALNPEGTETTSRDGMDAVLCMFDLKGGWLRFACANNPLWLIRNNELKEFGADKMPVGMHHGEIQPFALNTLGLRKGDMIYLFTDGYADQFGGEKGKKFKYKNLQKILLENSSRSMEEQRLVLDDAMKKWQGNMEQIDDILIIGMRF